MRSRVGPFAALRRAESEKTKLQHLAESVRSIRAKCGGHSRLVTRCEKLVCECCRVTTVRSRFERHEFAHGAKRVVRCPFQRVSRTAGGLTAVRPTRPHAVHSDRLLTLVPSGA